MSEVERQLGGVLVTDLVGSTSLRVRLGDEDADVVRRRHERLVGRIAACFGADVCHWLGDGILASFPSASAAMQAGIAIQRANELINRRRDRLAELSIRVGVGAGEVVRAGMEVAGRPVDDAVSLCNRAAGGQILCADKTLELIGNRMDLDAVRDADEIAIVRWPSPISVALSLGVPRALETERQLPFVGRDDVQSELRDAFAAVLTGRPRVVSIQGAAGIGKTRLSAEIAREAHELGAAILFGTCHADRQTANAPIAQAFRSWMEAAQDVAARLGPSGGELVRLVPELSQVVPGLDAPTASDAETERRRLYDAVGEWLVDASLDEPIVLILDSLHWGGVATFELLQHILPMLERARIMIVCVQRPMDDRTELLMRHVNDGLGPAACVQVDLLGIDERALVDLVGRVHRDGAGLQDAQLLHSVTSGNPLHLHEILRWEHSKASFPETIHAAVGQHLDRLGREQRRVLDAAAVLGAEFDARCLMEMTDERDASLEAIDAAVEAGLLLVASSTDLRYRFAHDLTRETVLDMIGNGRMTRLHEKAAMAIEAVGGGQEETLADLARHYSAAVALGHRDEAVEYAARAAEYASRRYENESAELLYEQALGFLDPEQHPDRWCDLSIGLGEAQRRMGKPEHRPLLLHVADRAAALEDGERMGHALLTTYRGTFSRAMQVDHEYVSRLRRAVALIGSGPSKMRARLLALLGVETTWAEDQEENRRVMNEAVAVARKLDDPDLLASVLAHRQWAVFHPLSERLSDTRELSALAERSADPFLRFDALGNELFSCLRSGDREGLDRCVTELRESAANVDQPLVRWMLVLREFALALMQGRFVEAEAFREEQCSLALATGQPDAEPTAIVLRFWLDVETQPVDVARSFTTSLARSYEHMPPMTAWSSIAFRSAELDLVEETREIVTAMAERGFETIPMDQRWLMTICGFGYAASVIGDEKAAFRLHGLLAPYAAEHANVLFATLGSVERYLGLMCRCLGRKEAVEHHLRSAMAENRRIGAVTWLGRSQLDYVDWRIERGTFDADCGELLSEATTAAADFGLPTLQERASRIAQML